MYIPNFLPVFSVCLVSCKPHSHMDCCIIIKLIVKCFCPNTVPINNVVFVTNIPYALPALSESSFHSIVLIFSLKKEIKV